MKVLMAGCNGMLARDLAPRLKAAGFHVHGFDLPELDISRYRATIDLVKAVRPGLGINCAAYTAVDRAESEPEAAFAVNREGSRHLASSCAGLGIPLIHISTDYIFDGKSERPYLEEDPANPLGVYGLSKWEGEEAIRSCLVEHLIVRTAWLFGVNGHNFVKTILTLAGDREELKVVADQHGCPTWTGDLADALTSLTTTILSSGNEIPWGTYHFCGAGRTTWHGFARTIVEGAGGRDRLVAKSVVPIASSDYPTTARRPRWSLLDCTKIAQSFSIIPPRWSDGLGNMLVELYGNANNHGKGERGASK